MGTNNIKNFEKKIECSYLLNSKILAGGGGMNKFFDDSISRVGLVFRCHSDTYTIFLGWRSLIQ